MSQVWIDQSRMDPGHPSNLPQWRKIMMLLTLSLAAWTANYSAACHLTAFGPISKDFGVSIAAVANSIGISILGLGIGALLWNPAANAFGRRPIYIVSFLLFIPCAFWLAFSKDYNTFAAGRFFAGFMGSSVQVLPATSIAETFSPEWRGTAIALWSLLLITGPVSAPLVTAAVIQTKPWQWAYYVVIILVGFSFIMIVLFCPETLYNSPANSSAAPRLPLVRAPSRDSASKDEKEQDLHQTVSRVENSDQKFGHVGAAYMPWHDWSRFFSDALQPFRQALYVVELLPAIWAAIAFGWSVGYTVVVPQRMEEAPYNFSTLIVGVVFMAALGGSLIGKIGGGFVADVTVTYLTKRSTSTERVPEYRLWNLLWSSPLLLLALLLFGLGLENEKPWPMPVIGGIGLYYIALNTLTGVVQTYMVECDISKAMSSIALFNLIKCIFAFAVPFFVPEWAFKGFGKSYTVQGVLVSALGLILAITLILYGKKIRKYQKMPIIQMPR